MSPEPEAKKLPLRPAEGHIVTAGEAGARLDRWFRRRFPRVGYGRLARLLRTGQIRLDGKRVGGNARLEAGQKIRIPPMPEEADKPRRAVSREASPEDAAFLRDLLLYRDDFVLALNKPAGLAVQGGSGLRRHLDGMLDGLRLGYGEPPRLTHRLDKDVSGVLLLGRTPAATAGLCAAFRQRQARKLYWALVCGAPAQAQGEVESAMEKQERGGREKVASGRGKHARTRYVVLESLSSRVSWVAFAPESGRTHQLRVHACAMGTPILGDGKYGGAAARRLASEMGLADGLHLHARRLRLPHPAAKGKWLDVSAPLPPHMARAWEDLGLEEGGENEAAVGRLWNQGRDA